ncbi:glycoside hydrolase family 55 [Fusarium longipes]|uniref:Glycoside hydrolase family 55 n=1 Tax=Fusarium longipes TaxID=694270 RepID=A0A395SH05_9HYPO|nr:glycoside hydrolase family 55 [Fusarium longipes]
MLKQLALFSIAAIGAAAAPPLNNGSQATGYWYADMDHTGDFRGKAPYVGDSYEVFKTVAVGDGKAIQDAIDSGDRHQQWLASEPRVVYLPSGTYEVENTIHLRTDTILMGNAVDPPIIKASPDFNGSTLVDGMDSSVGGRGEISFSVGVKNVILDTTAFDNNKEFTALYWGVAQVCQLQNIHIRMPKAGTDFGHSGMRLGRGSTLSVADVCVEGGTNGIWHDGHQQTFYNSINFIGNVVGLRIDGGNTITLLNPTFENVTTPVKHISGSPFVGIVDATSINSGVTFNSSGYASLLIENLDKDTDSDVVRLPIGVALGKASHVDTFTYGNTVGRDPVYGGSTTNVARPEAVAPGGRIPAIVAPTYGDHPVGDFINIKDTKQNGGHVIKGDGQGNEVEALTAVLKYAADNNKIAYFPFGDYRVESTLLIPIGSRIVGEAWSTISAAGEFFKDADAPKPVVQIGASGDVGTIQVQDMRFTVADVLPGAIILEFNAAGSKPGDVAVWNSAVTVGGTLGANALTDNCRDASNPCQGAYMGMHFTKDSSAYVENVWNWVADHITEEFDGGSSIAGKGGVLVESTKGTWLHAVGSEHWWLYQLNLHNASNVVVSMLQTETNYEQGANAQKLLPSPWSPDQGDPNYDWCGSTDGFCRMGLSNYVNGGSNIYYYGSASWAFYNGPGQFCDDVNNCQEYIHWIEKTPENLQSFGWCARASQVALRLGNGDKIMTDPDFTGSWGSLVGLHPVSAPTNDVSSSGACTLVISQSNFKGSGQRERMLMEFDANTPGWVEPRVIVGCDASYREPWKSFGNYHLDTKPARTLVETDNPDDPNRKRGKPPKSRGRKPKKPPVESNNTETPPAKAPPVAMTRVFFLVHKSIPRHSWNVEWYQDNNSEMVATLHMATVGGDIHIHSVYNPNQPGQTIDIQQMIDTTTTSCADIVMGDFNFHHESWSGNLLRKNTTTPSAQNLDIGMRDANMKLLTTPGTVTFKSTEGHDALQSCLDLTFVSPSLKDSVKSCQVYQRNPWPDSDHRPIWTIFNIKPRQDDTLRYLFNKADKDSFNKLVAEGLPPLDNLEATVMDESQVETLARQLSESLSRAIHETVPTVLVNPPPRRRPMDLKARQFLYGNGIPSLHSESPDTPVTSRAQKPREARANKPNPYRDYLHTLGESTNGTWKAAKIGERRSRPRIVANMPPLQDPGDKSKFITSETEKQDLVFNTLWEGSDSIENPTTVPFPILDPDRQVLEMDISLVEKAVRDLVNRLPLRKSPGPDEVPNEALKLARDTIVPYLTILFRACLDLSYYPDAFKNALTVIIPKPDKESYALAKSWRPIALLSTVGKLLEKILANILKKVTIDKELLPHSQFGQPGGSTSKCLKSLLYTVHKHWNRKMSKRINRLSQKVTMMGLDISGAFDKVRRSIALQELANFGLPEKFLRMMQSFLSKRHTFLKLPQSMSSLKLVNIGIPQGSPLSPLLFLFFAAPLLHRLNSLRITGVILSAFSYVDDTYIMVVSQSFADNCRALEKAQKTIDEWAEETGTTFSPGKYSIIHFNNPEDKSDDCHLLPNIPGIAGNPSCLKNNKLKVLGVVIDSRLTFNSHIDDIESKVAKKLRHLRFISRRKSGLTVQKAREFYMGSILPIFAYACEAWFLHHPHKRLPQSLKRGITRLESIQYKALKVVTAYFGHTPTQVVLKEFDIPNIRVYLYRRAQSARALSLGMLDKYPFVKRPRFEPCDARQWRKTSTDILDNEAYSLAIRAAEYLLEKKGGDVEKFLEVWRVDKKRKDAINDQAFEESEERSSKIWDDYRRERAIRHSSGHRPASLREDWGPESFDLYEGLSRGQSTLLLELRTEKIALNGPMSDMKLTRPVKILSEATGRFEQSPHLIEYVPAACPCGHRKQTVYHMFFHCPNLDAARKRLVSYIGKLDWRTLLTVHAKTATEWAMVYFGLAQYDYILEDSRFYEPPPPSTTSA